MALLSLAYVFAGIGLGDWGLNRWSALRAGRLAPRIGAAAAALLVLALLGWIPGVGAMVGLVAMLAGLGVLLLQVRRGGV